MGVKIDILTPFDHCKDCGRFDIEDDAYYSDDGCIFHQFSCKNDYICENAARIYQMDLEEKKMNEGIHHQD